MKKLIKTIVGYVVAGAAVTAGAALWSNLLEGKITKFFEKRRTQN